ncbi:MAG TPA: hypothetical protein VFG52_05990, partial [Xanthomonadales bacterium]|nr:hypothetical protein [Xanthomonadales bacterium]
HHDGGTGENDDASDPGRARFDPFRPTGEYITSGELAGDHKHYSQTRTGGLEVVEVGDTYVEACRLVRKDGFFRVAQDLRQEGLNSFPSDYLDGPTEVDEYSDYVTASVSLFEAAAGNGYELADPPVLLTLPGDMATPVTFPASTLATATLMTSVGRPTQQLRGRGIYIDYMSDELRDIITCMENEGTDCGAAGANSPLEVIPFYDVQLTWLARWNETPDNRPIDVTNEAVQDGNTHSRGLAGIAFGAQGDSTITTAIHRGNLGLTATGATDPYYSSDLRTYSLFATANAPSTPPITGYKVTGLISSGAKGFTKLDDIVITTTAGQCERTPLGFECTIPTSAINPRLTVASYFKFQKTLVACSTVMSINGTNHSSTTPGDNWTRFNLPSMQTLNADVVIKENTCL